MKLPPRLGLSFPQCTRTRMRGMPTGRWGLLWGLIRAVGEAEQYCDKGTFSFLLLSFLGPSLPYKRCFGAQEHHGNPSARVPAVLKPRRSGLVHPDCANCLVPGAGTVGSVQGHWLGGCLMGRGAPSRRLRVPSQGCSLLAPKVEGTGTQRATQPSGPLAAAPGEQRAEWSHLLSPTSLSLLPAFPWIPLTPSFSLSSAPGNRRGLLWGHR